MKAAEQIVETIIHVKFPLKRISRPDAKWLRLYPRRVRWFGWLFSWDGGAVGDCSGRTNTVRHLTLFRRHIFTIHRNEYHDRSDKERADEYLGKWSECEKELKMFRLVALGEGIDEDVKQVIRESLGIDLDEGTIK